MYKSIYYDDRSKTIHLWGDGKHDDEGYQTFKYQPYAYLASDNGKYTTIDGFKCDKVEHWSDTAAQMGMVYEHDVPPTTRFLIDKYWETDEVSKDNKVLFLDIEIEKGDRYSKPSEAYNVINAMTYRATGDEHYTCLIIADRSSKKEIDVQITDDKTERAVLYSFTSEEELLTFFIRDYVEIGHNIITGWNVEFFDMPYLYNRLRNVFDIKTAKKLSLDAEIVTVRDTTFGQIISMAGVAVLDYLDLYRKFTYTELSNYRLDTVSKHELKRGKVEYEGDLDHLYKTDPERYAYYNIVDVELVMSLDKKLQFIETALGICHKGHCSHSDVKWTSAYLDGAALTFCRRKGLVASSNRSKKDRKAKGAFVQKPVPGLYKWIFDLDLTSLYPMTIISLNISPETKFGRVLDWDEEEYATKKNSNRKYTIELIKDNTPLDQFTDIIMKTERNNVIEVVNLTAYLERNNLSIASNGIMYTLDKQGFIPAILSMWFDERDEYKGLRKKYENEGDEKLANFYDQQQLITKILLNSFYGVLLLESFRFYDRENGESVTLTGQSVINWSSRAADVLYNKELNTHDKYCKYVDTDSIFYPIEPIFNHRYGDMDDYSDDEILKKSRPIINDVQEFINKSYNIYSQKYHNITEHRWEIKQEYVAKRAFWVGKLNSKTKKVEGVKKRYAQLIVEKEGFKTEFMDVKGLDVVRSNFPTAFREFMNELLIDILNDQSKDTLNEKVQKYKSTVNNCNYKDIMAPSGIKDITKYTTDGVGNRKSGTPVHVKAALSYNDLMTMNSITNIPNINDGDKILWAYVRTNKYGFNEVALKGFEDPKVIEEFVENNIDRNKMFERLLLKKIRNFWLSLGWGEIQLNALGNKFFNF